MSMPRYIDIFQDAADQIDRQFLAEKQLEIAVGVYQNSTFLKVFKNVLKSAGNYFLSVGMSS